MASSSSQRSKHPRGSSSSNPQVAQIDQSVNVRESRNSNGSSSTSAKHPNISRRKSTPSVHSSRSSLTSKTTVPSQRSRSNLHRTTMELTNEDKGDEEDESTEDLNASFASTATVNIDTSQTPHNDHSSTSVNTNQNAKKVLRKQAVINTYYTKIDTGGYYCNLCNGTKNSNKVNAYPPISHVKSPQFDSCKLKYMMNNVLEKSFPK